MGFPCRDKNVIQTMQIGQVAHAEEPISMIGVRFRFS